MMRVGVISDTHGLMRPEALTALEGVSMILHAGDVGTMQVLESLRRIAPVVTVEGNVDVGRWSPPLPKTKIIDVEAAMLYMLHRIDDLDLNPATAGFKAVIYGHSHKPSQEVRDGVLYLNPGSIGPRRFDLPISMALMDVEGDQLTVTRIDLNV